MIDQRAPPPALDGVAISEARSSPMGAPSTESGRNLALGILLIVAAFLCVAVMSAFGKAAAAMPTAVISFSQSFISLVVFLPWVLRGGRSQVRTGRLPIHVLRALAGLLSQVLYFWSVKDMSLVDAVLLVNAAQLLIILAYEHATASQIAPFNYSVVLFSVAIGWIVWHDVLDWIAVLGILLVCAGGICSVVLARPRQIGHGFWLSHGHGGQRLPDPVPSKP